MILALMNETIIFLCYYDIEEPVRNIINVNARRSENDMVLGNTEKWQGQV